ncbi:MAG: 1-acyl-sn-glycerol-3-phosphate acyltransferase [Clostridia bacterium]|nr:1-acyl-sn-glycerol-3-phosphate acyltransferase [Clostridia bacterium]MBR5987136.1 1-acyl-sn-glycerol-3-phosphate acyltransferase [Clostridia bacterium]
MASPFISLIHPTTVINKEKFSLESAVVCCNHYASSDVLIVASKLFKKELNVLGKAELFKNKFSSWFLTKMGAIKVNRGTPEVSVHKEILKRLKRGSQILIFPEGTRNKAGTHEMAEFKSGAGVYAIKAKVPIIPLMFHHQSKAFHRNYLIVGDPIDLSAFYGKNMHDVKDEVAAYLHDKMEDLHKELDQKVADLTACKKK